MSEVVKVDPEAIEQFVQDLRGFIQKYEEGFRELNARFSSMSWNDRKQEEFHEQLSKSYKVLDAFSTYTISEIPRLSLLAEKLKERVSTGSGQSSASMTTSVSNSLSNMNSASDQWRKYRAAFEKYLQSSKKEEQLVEMVYLVEAFMEESQTVTIEEQETLLKELRDYINPQELWVTNSLDSMVKQLCDVIRKLLTKYF